jgi:hypothetical protein
MRTTLSSGKRALTFVEASSAGAIGHVDEPASQDPSRQTPGTVLSCARAAEYTTQQNSASAAAIMALLRHRIV